MHYKCFNLLTIGHQQKSFSGFKPEIYQQYLTSTMCSLFTASRKRQHIASLLVSLHLPPIVFFRIYIEILWLFMATLKIGSESLYPHQSVHRSSDKNLLFLYLDLRLMTTVPWLSEHPGFRMISLRNYSMREINLIQL